MIATFITLIFSLIILLNWGFYYEPLPTDVISYTEGFYGLGFLLALIFNLVGDRADQIRYQKMYSTSLTLKNSYLSMLLFGYPIFTFAIAVFQASRLIPNGLFLVPIWLIISGLATDGLFRLTRSSNSLKGILGTIQDKIKKSKNVHEFQENIDALAEVTAKGIENHSIFAVNQSLNAFSTIYDQLPQEEGKEVRILYPLEMLEMLSRLAIEKNQTGIAQKIFSTFGTLGLNSLKIDPQLALFALIKLETGTLLAFRKGLYDLALKGNITLQQTALYSPENKGWGDFVAQAVRSLDILAKENFKQDKHQSISNLITPIVELDLGLKAYETSAEYPLAKREISRVIGEFATLETVLKTIPKIEEEIGQTK